MIDSVIFGHNIRRMAVLLALVMVIPVLLGWGLIALWVRKTSGAVASSRRRNLSLAFAFLVLCTWANWNALSELRIFRKISGTCMLVLLNQSDCELIDVELVYQSTSSPNTNRWDRMAVGNRSTFKTRADTVRVERFAGMCGTNSFFFQETLKRGQRLTLRIEAGGKISSQFD